MNLTLENSRFTFFSFKFYTLSLEIKYIFIKNKYLNLKNSISHQNFYIEKLKSNYRKIIEKLPLILKAPLNKFVNL